MKTTLLAVSAFMAVFALLMSGAVMGSMASEAPEKRAYETGTDESQNIEETYAEVPYEWDVIESAPDIEKEISDLVNGTDDNDEFDETAGVDFGAMVKRGYRILTSGFNTANSRWERLPEVKDIHGADDPGRWMLGYLKNHTEEGINVTDSDNDGIPEKVVIVKRFPSVDSTGSEDAPALEPSLTAYEETPNSTSSVIGGWRFLYMDSDDDGTPESISLMVRMRIIFDRDGDGRPQAVLSFSWNGRSHDRDGDGTWDAEGYVTSENALVDMNSDRNPEKRYHHSASYMRMDTAGRPLWDVIGASSRTGYMIDADSDGNPERMGVQHMNGRWRDRNGNGWPEVIEVKAARSEALDRDSDGNREMRDRVIVSGMFIDRNDDMNPELVRISYARTTFFDTDDDGKVDVIRTVSRVFSWIDRNSDGKPELVRRSFDERIHRPSRRNTDQSSLRERVRKRIGDPKDDRKGEDSDRSVNPDSRRPEGPKRR